MIEDEGYMPKDKVFFTRKDSGEQGAGLIGAVVLGIIVAALFIGLFAYGFGEAVTRERTPVTLLTPTTGG